MTRFVIHADDVGFSYGSNVAFMELAALGTITAGSAMVPCPWFHDLARRVAEADRPVDLGVHLTLNSEHTGFRWAPMTARSPASGLVDGDGYMWSRVADVRDHADPDAVEAEWRAQVDRALAAGIDVTHLDAHMGAALAPEWCERYVALGVDYGVPVLMPRDLAAYGPSNHLSGAGEEAFSEFVHQARGAGMPVFDEVLETDFRRPRGAPVDYATMLRGADENTGADLVYCAFHPCAPGEVEVIDDEWWHVRVDEYELFRTADWRRWLDEQPFDTVGMGELRAEWRAARAGATV